MRFLLISIPKYSNTVMNRRYDVILYQIYSRTYHVEICVITKIRFDKNESCIDSTV